MKYTFSGKNIDVTDALKEKLVRKLSKLEKYFTVDVEAHVKMLVEKNRHIVEVTIPINNIILRAEESSNDMYSSIDTVIDILERQIRRNKTRLAKRLRPGIHVQEYFQQPAGEEEEKEYKVVRIKKFPIKPMNVEEAILQMNLLGHEFYMFTDAETQGASLVYKRKDGNYGLIEPET